MRDPDTAKPARAPPGRESTREAGVQAAGPGQGRKVVVGPLLAAQAGGSAEFVGEQRVVAAGAARGGGVGVHEVLLMVRRDEDRGPGRWGTAGRGRATAAGGR
ncbi:hypothetical protein LUW77_03285 [Streptomyces radiopugnans]|nr:hypothetical protein LUW77_03285 [Streptomyces radiopugnans]